MTAGLIGAVVVFLFIGLVVPKPSEVANDWDVLLINLIAMAIYAPLAFTVVTLHNRAVFGRAHRWLVEERDPSSGERELTLRLPIRQCIAPAAGWAGAAAVFFVLNAFLSIELAALVAAANLLGGLTTCALTYLRAERIGRDATVRALATGVPEEPAAPGVTTRTLLAWALGTGIPLLGVGLIALAVLLGADVGATQLAFSALFLASVGMVVGLAAMQIAARSVADPVESVRAALRQIEAGQLEGDVPVYDGSEVGLLQAGFNRMVAGLRDREKLRHAFGAFVDPALAERVLREGTDLAGEEVELSVLFMDVRGFTTFSEGAEAKDVVARLNDLYGQVVPVILRHGGHANKFIGDGLLAVFGAPERHPDHADRAVHAAQEIAELVQHRYDGYLRVGIGVNSGRVVVGTIGGGGRLDFTVIGDPVNTAARVEAVTRETDDDLLITEATLNSLRRMDGFEERPTVALKGKTETVRLFAPAPAHEAAPGS
jgi:adenylate cyclase